MDRIRGRDLLPGLGRAAHHGTITGIAERAADSLGIARSIRTILVENTDSPWNEKALIKRKGRSLDVKITVWNDQALLFGRVFRLFLYIADVLDSQFLYNPKIAPDEEKEPGVLARYNQLWSIYVDSRMERRGIDCFFDRTTRRNLFLDMEKSMSWDEADALFRRLWLKEAFSYPEIIYLSRNLESLMSRQDAIADSPETEINAALKAVHVRDHLERIGTEECRETVNEILSFTAYHCRECRITTSYYGISFVFQHMVLGELIYASDDLLYLTLLNAGGTYETASLRPPFELETAQTSIKRAYDALAARSREM